MTQTQTLDLTPGHSFIRIPTGVPADHPEAVKTKNTADALEVALESFQEEARKLAGDPGKAAAERREQLKAEVVQLKDRIRARAPSREDFEEARAAALEPANRFRDVGGGRPASEVHGLMGEVRAELLRILRENPQDGRRLVRERLEDAIRAGDDLALLAAMRAPASLKILEEGDREALLEFHLEVNDPEKAAHLHAWSAALSAADFNFNRADEVLRSLTGDATLGREIAAMAPGA